MSLRNTQLIHFPTIRLVTSFMPIGCTPGFLSSGMSLHATNASRVLGSRYSVANSRAKVASWTRSSLFSFLHLLLIRGPRYCSASSREDLPAPFVMLADLKTIVSSISSKYEGRTRLTGPLSNVSDFEWAFQRGFFFFVYFTFALWCQRFINHSRWWFLYD